ncbi:hypothetical protein AVEN_211448-1 [Araneus ventricosus]|uniref:Uncharacterized protein n=1 Tax=Araneus ventricosus TaxID=182803 RepID=A0A4Y2TME9_ARAVE|nr:hypothetical protein AVEN_98486-1 [Araneus ventricosus]GBO01247.1 hypothetical protein AVEN_211448-1 [Araneus ventricosus]
MVWLFVGCQHLKVKFFDGYNMLGSSHLHSVAEAAGSPRRERSHVFREQETGRRTKRKEEWDQTDDRRTERHALNGLLFFLSIFRRMHSSIYVYMCKFT